MSKYQFLKPTLNFVRGDIVELDDDYVEDVVKPYVAKNFKGEEQKNRYAKVSESKKSVKVDKKTGAPKKNKDQE